MYTIVNEEFTKQLNKSNQDEWLFLEEHPDFKGCWKVDCFDSAFFFEFQDLIGPYRVVQPKQLSEFEELAKTLGYRVAFFEDPSSLIEAYSLLGVDPDITINSNFEGTINGFLPYQIEGYNLLKDLPAGIALWDTGAGKAVLASALIKRHYGNFDTAFVVVKATNKVNMQRKILQFTDLEGHVVPEKKKKRLALYEDLLEKSGQIVCANYENFREDKDAIVKLFQDRRILCCWDEAPTRLKNRTTQLYKAVKYCLYDINGPSVEWKKKRPSWLVQYVFTATPVENNPEDHFNVTRLISPDTFGTVKQFRDEFVSTYNFFDKHKPETWHKLDKMNLMLSPITHRVDKEKDPEVSKQFPQVHEEIFYVDWTPADKKLYKEILKRGNEAGVNPIALITLLQMVCDEPSMLNDSAKIYEAYESSYQEWQEGNAEAMPVKKGSETAAMLIEGLDFSNKRHGKQEVLEMLLTEKHKDEKTLVFSALNQTLMPTLEELMQKWSIPYVRYHGTAVQRQEAEDRFMEDPDIMVFLSSDLGSDSLDLYKGQNVIHYNLPWKWSTKIQRQNRIHRASSDHSWNRVYTLVYNQSVEERKNKVIDRKHEYHTAIVNGHSREFGSGGFTKDDLDFILGI